MPAIPSITPLCLRATIHEATKPRADSEVPKYKAHCVYNGKQRVNRTLIETFSPAVRHTTVMAHVKASVRVLGLGAVTGRPGRVPCVLDPPLGAPFCVEQGGNDSTRSS